MTIEVSADGSTQQLHRALRFEAVAKVDTSLNPKTICCNVCCVGSIQQQAVKVCFYEADAFSKGAFLETKGNINRCELQLKRVVNSRAFNVDSAMGRELLGVGVGAKPCDASGSKDALCFSLAGVGRIIVFVLPGAEVCDPPLGDGAEKFFFGRREAGARDRLNGWSCKGDQFIGPAWNAIGHGLLLAQIKWGLKGFWSG
ncbi:MAG: hypothetical protein NTY01_03375 [Verrucomicrobia bacterium]|nr:hypothetical protein [Verrucomicrobiota bacterium]